MGGRQKRGRVRRHRCHRWNGSRNWRVTKNLDIEPKIKFGFRYGEVVPLGSTYLPSFAEGVRAGLREMGPSLIGQDPRKVNVIYAVMDSTLKGHHYAKAPIDMACWDILGKVQPYNSCPLFKVSVLFKNVLSGLWYVHRLAFGWGLRLLDSTFKVVESDWKNGRASEELQNTSNLRSRPWLLMANVF